MRKGLYPKVLVVSQYGLMSLMFFFSDGFPKGLALWVFTPGFLIGLWALAHNRLGNFNIRPEFKVGAKLITTGAYRYIRHPMYLSVALMMLAISIHTPSSIEWCMFIALLLTLYLKASREEKLWADENPAYKDYQKNTKLFLPFIL